MPFFGARRTRQTRVFRPTPTAWEKATAALQDYRVLTLLLIAGFAVLSMNIALQTWRSHFPYREGQAISHGIQSRVDFRIENVLATRQAQAEAKARSAPIFVQNDAVLEELRASFRNDLNSIANAASLDELDSLVVDTFKLGTDIPGDVENNRPPTTRFAQVRLAMTESGMPVGERVDLMAEEFNQLISGAETIGMLNKGELARIPLPPKDLEPQKRVELVDTSSEPLGADSTVVADISLEDQLLPTGRLGGAWVALSNLQQIRPAVETWLRSRFRGQLSYDADATELRKREAVEKVEPQYDSFAAGISLVRAGVWIEPQHLEVLRAEHDAHELQVSFGQRLWRVAGATLMMTLLVVLFSIYIYRNPGDMLDEFGHLIAFVLICAVSLFLSCSLSRDPWRAEVVPLLAAVMIVTIVYSQGLAVLTGFALSLLVSMATVWQLSQFATLMTLCLTVIIPLRSVSSRSTLIKLGFMTGLVAFVSAWGINLIGAYDFSESWRNPAAFLIALKFAGWSVVCCYLVAGSLPFIESAFGIVTDISLLELSDVSHPLLQELARRAPGTYNHSISVATIGEAAADAIGANGLLLRVGAYFHDIGKMLKPEYFIENMASGQQSPHENLAPAMSALIIIGHVKDGVELAEQHNLPRKLIHFIEQHHGTTLVEYFFREAANRADEDHRTDADESTFRYPGPRPRTKETGVMMLTDAVESASRTLSEPTPKRIQSLVRDIALKRVLDGQFDECGLTMSEIRVVQESLVKSLLAVHHGRIKYPDQKTA